MATCTGQFYAPIGHSLSIIIAAGGMRERPLCFTGVLFFFFSRMPRRGRSPNWTLPHVWKRARSVKGHPKLGSIHEKTWGPKTWAKNCLFSGGFTTTSRLPKYKYLRKETCSEVSEIWKCTSKRKRCSYYKGRIHSQNLANGWDVPNFHPLCKFRILPLPAGSHGDHRMELNRTLPPVRKSADLIKWTLKIWVPPPKTWGAKNCLFGVVLWRHVSTDNFEKKHTADKRKKINSKGHLHSLKIWWTAEITCPIFTHLLVVLVQFKREYLWNENETCYRQFQSFSNDEESLTFSVIWYWWSPQRAKITSCFFTHPLQFSHGTRDGIRSLCIIVFA